MSERRISQRVRVNLNARWEGVLARREGTICDISSTGCFILTSDEVEQGELVRLEIETPTEGWIYLWGEVVYLIKEMGFAVHFTGAGENEQAMLDLLLDYYGPEEPSSADEVKQS
jgi:PilZ domain